MKRKGGKTAKWVMALICTGILWFAGADFFGVPNASAQSFFQTYTKPQTIPEFSVQDLQGKNVNIRDHRGQIILLNFWATW